MGFTEKRWKENIFLLVLFAGLVFVCFFFFKQKYGLTAQEREAYSISNTSLENNTSHLPDEKDSKNFEQIQVPDFLQKYYDFTKTSFSKEGNGKNLSSAPTWQSSKYYTDYLLADFDKSFDYRTVIKNCHMNGKAPLYFFIFHILSSMFPYFSIKYIGFALNLVFALVIFFILFYICRKRLHSIPAGFSACILFCFSIGMVSAVMCTQNYLMTTLLLLLSCALHMNLLHEEEDRVWNLRFLILVTILGCLTDYQFVAFSSVIFILTILTMLCFNQYKNLLKYLIGMTISGIIVILVYPAIVTHISYYINQILSHPQSGLLASILSDYIHAIQNYLLIRGNLCFAFLFLFMIVCMLALVLNVSSLGTHFENFKKRVAEMEVDDVFLFLLFFAYTGVLILFQIPCTIQTFFVLLPLGAMLLCYMLYRLCHVFLKEDIHAGLFLGAIVSIVCFLSLFTYEPDFLQKENKETLALANSYAHTPCVFVENEETDVYDYLLEMGIHDNSVLTNTNQVKELKNDKIIRTSDKLVLYLDNQEFYDDIVTDMVNYGKFSFSECICKVRSSLGDMRVYLLYR